MNRRTVLGLAMALAFSFTGQAWAKPNFSGSWKMNAAKSDFGPVPAPDKMDRKIEHDDPTMKLTTTQSGPQGERTTNLAYKTDGSESKNTLGGTEVVSVVKWDGDQLTVSSKREMQGMEITMNERWKLSEDGKVLTIANKISTPQGEIEITVVMDKQ